TDIARTLKSDTHIRIDRVRAPRQKIAMNGKSLGRLDAAFAVDLCHLIQKRQLLFRYVRAGLVQSRNRLREFQVHRLIQILQRVAYRDTNSQSAERYRLERPVPFLGPDL